MQLTEFEQMKVKNTIRKMARVLMFAFSKNSCLFIGFYALMTAQMFIEKYFDEECQNETEFVNIKRCLLKNLSEFTKSMYAQEFKGGNNVGH
jgi:hypothetical protein